VVPAVPAAWRIKHVHHIEAFALLDQRLRADDTDGVRASRATAMGNNMAVAVRLVCPTKLVLGEIVDAALRVEGSTAAGLAATDIGARAVAVNTKKREATPGLGADVFHEEAQDADTVVTALDEIGAQVLQEGERRGSERQGERGFRRFCPAWPLKLMALTRQLWCTIIFPSSMVRPKDNGSSVSLLRHSTQFFAMIAF